MFKTNSCNLYNDFKSTPDTVHLIVRFSFVWMINDNGLVMNVVERMIII